MYGCESWTVKKAERRRIDAFELWCWRRLLRVPWTARRSNQSILKEVSPGISLEGMMLKLKLQYFGHLMQRTDSLEKTLMLGGIGGRRRRGRRRIRWLDGITDLMDVESEWTPGDGGGQGGLKCCNSWGRKESDTTERLNWTEIRPKKSFYFYTHFIFTYKVHGILLARILEWVAFPFSRGSSQPRDWTQVSCITADSFPAEAQGKPGNTEMGSLSLLQRIFLTHELNSGLLRCRQILY